ncbi:MAG: DNA mismatch repair protein MutS, partial [Cyanobacteria bacterium M_DeepCast_100m_m1_067]|nr:DNA mismatch repair protein MutS [Cyanobacteria bacterium M_DeepCast_100m_m1_067]
MAAPAEQPLQITLQGDLFGAAQPQAAPAAASPEPTADPEATEQLIADAERRPRARQRPINNNTKADEPAATADTPPGDSDLPPWHHHSLVDPQQLTPMLRHYV